MLQNDHGLDARDVDVIVGTSAGAITGMLLRLDVSAEDLAAWADVQWPERDLWIPAVRRRDGRRVVFGRTGTPPAPRGLAVAVVRGARLFRSGAHR